MTSLLDSLVETIIDGRGIDVTFIELDPPCAFPLFAATIGYKRGCRCLRCYDAQAMR
jgi:hypothetical protein